MYTRLLPLVPKLRLFPGTAGTGVNGVSGFHSTTRPQTPLHSYVSSLKHQMVTILLASPTAR
jgi:hypothetical protein